ncbi:MAG: hypothetical protein JNK82_18495 [Myxococcaceae bacterium]|nr:hypothetical protein [Myxococcaceae bacterium]
MSDAVAMPPDVFLALASSGISLIASLMFLVTPPLPAKEPDDDPRLHVPFLLPPARVAKPPPLPPARECTVDVSQSSLQAVMAFKLSGDEFVVTLECVPRPDAAALQVDGGRGHGAVNDLRWHGQAGLARSTKQQWKLKPGRA